MQSVGHDIEYLQTYLHLYPSDDLVVDFDGRRRRSRLRMAKADIAPVQHMPHNSSVAYRYMWSEDDAMNAEVALLLSKVQPSICSGEEDKYIIIDIQPLIY